MAKPEVNVEMFLDLEKTYGRVAAVKLHGHVMYFARPTRDQIHDWRRKEDSPQEKASRTDLLAQQTIVAFDEERDKVKVVQMFGNFLDAYPMACESGKLGEALSLLGGVVEEEDARNLGKGVTLRSNLPKPSEKDSAIS